MKKRVVKARIEPWDDQAKRNAAKPPSKTVLSCEHCGKPLQTVTQTWNTEIGWTWEWDAQKKGGAGYVPKGKQFETGIGSSSDLSCDECEEKIDVEILLENGG